MSLVIYHFLANLMAESSRTSAHAALMISRVGKWNRLLDNREITAAQLRLKLRLLDAFDWPQAFPLEVEVDKSMNPNKLFQRSRLSFLPKKDYLNLKMGLPNMSPTIPNPPRPMGNLEGCDRPV